MALKVLLFLAVVFAAMWWLRGGTRRGSRRDEAPRESPAVQPMVRCGRCGVHLPRREAVVGAGGLYCSEAHRLEHGDGAPR